MGTALRIESPRGLVAWVTLGGESRNHLDVCSVDCAFLLGLDASERLRRRGDRYPMG